MHRGWNRPGGWLSDPARLDLTGLGTRRLLKLSREIGLGEERPTWLIVAPDKEHANLYLIPTAAHPLAIEITYPHGRGYVNLIKILTLLDRIAAPNTKEFYPLEFSNRPVSVNGELTRALVMPLKRPAAKVKVSKVGTGKNATAAKANAEGDEKKAKTTKPA